MSPVISISQPLQEPASTSRTASARPKRRRDRTSTSRTRWMTPSGAASSGSVASPTVSIFRNSCIRGILAVAALALQVPQHGARPDELIVEDAPGHLEQLADQRVSHRVPDGGPVLSGLDNVP